MGPEPGTGRTEGGLLWDAQAQRACPQHGGSSQGIQVPLTGLQAKLCIGHGVGDEALEPGKTSRGRTRSGCARLCPAGVGVCEAGLWLLVPREVLARGGSLRSLCVRPPRAGTPCLASVPACTLSSAPSLMMSTGSWPTWELLSSRPQGKGTTSVGRRKPSAAGPCRPSRSVHSWSCPTAWRACCGAFVPRTPVLGILRARPLPGPLGMVSGVGWGCRPRPQVAAALSHHPPRRTPL